MHIHCTGKAGKKRADGKCQHLILAHIDAHALCGVGIFTHGDECAPDLGIHQKHLCQQEQEHTDQAKKIETQIGIQFKAKQAYIGARHAAQVAGDLAGGMCNELIDDLAKGNRRQRQKVKHQLGCRICQQHPDQRRQNCAKDHAQNGWQTEVVGNDAGGVCPDGIKRNVTDGYLPAVAEAYVQPRHGNDIDLDQAAQQHAIAIAESEHDKGQNRRDHRKQPKLCKALFLFQQFDSPPYTS